ncbi:DEHA2F23452p [Debaryomyces hansenii CBS767]|uniref:Serine/threonine-protein kinase TOR n=1 Tax=Debaryomyces hansenii (strain ATCC 36239 / CBS 767 / BCRC 21394 / JCM 1990 / NBRC 0083 / IGC 2968) TaxID=284592 RepID=B5RUM4_DEBHA|nr:DEHA2F23452p [Debaryomyces hansenii CBS767]CAR66402.1 DEHA2F23452p [Debaryomyces hansenii CBS767]|eukprot:XP_002770885.1 DEHA2F23452p [Debaryomyces hansenii CBS767]
MSTTQLQIVDGIALTQIFNGLKSNKEEERNRYALELRNYLASIARDLSPEQFNRYNNDINKTIFEFLHSNETSEKLGGIAALNSLIDFDSGVGEENATKTARFSNYLGSLILSNDLTIMKQATMTLGKLATPGGTLTGDFVDFEAKRAIEWLQSDNKQHENRRHAAILIITALVDNAPTLLYNFINQILEHLWIPLRDSKLVIRTDAAIALQKCMRIIYDRDINSRRFWIKHFIDMASKILNENVARNPTSESNDSSNNGSGNNSVNSVNAAASTAYNLIYSTATGSQTNESIHGSLLVYRELITFHSDPYIHSKFELIYENTVLYRNHKQAIIRQELTKIIPLLCKVNTELFVEKYLHRTLLHYLSQLKQLKSQHSETANNDKSAIFRSIGLISLEVGNQMATYLDAILDNIRDGLSYPSNPSVQSILVNAVSNNGDNPLSGAVTSSNGSSQSTINGLNSISTSGSGPTKYRLSRKNTEPAIFDCISKLSIAVGPALTKHLQRDILDMMFSNCSLSVYMQNVLQTLIVNIPMLTNLISMKLLNLLSLVLSGKIFQPPGSPYGSIKMNESLARDYRLIMISRDTGLSINSILNDADDYENYDSAILVQALNMLAFFEFENYQLNEFVRYCTITYLEHNVPKVRQTATITSCEIFIKDPICQQTSVNALNAVNEVLDKLLSIAITDPIPEIRLEGLNCLANAGNFDPQLSQANNVRLLFIALNDEVFSIRKIAIKILGRLSSINPAYIVPSLRKTLIQLLSRLEYSPTSRKKEESATLISLLISNSKELTRPYVKPIVEALLPKAKDPSSSVAASAINCLGELAVVGGEDLQPFIPDLMPLILETFQDQSSSYKRDAALKTLGQLASSSGYVIKPLLDYPQLLGMLVGILKSESSPHIRRETVRLLGILGALDPYKHREVEQNSKNIPSEQNAPPVDVALLMQGMSPSNDEYYPTVAINNLMKILKDPSLTAHHNKVIQAIMYIFQTLGLRCVSFLPQIIPGIINVMNTCQPSMLKFYFQQLGALILIVKQHIRPFLPEIFEVIKESFNINIQLNVQVIIINLIESISRALEGEFKMHLPDVLNLMLNVFEDDKSVKREPSLHVLKAFVVFGSSIEEYVHIIVPNIVKMFEMGPIVLRRAAIETIGRLSKQVLLNDMASRIIHPILRVLRQGNDELKTTAMNTLSYLLLQLGNEFSVFIPVIKSLLIQQKIHSAIFEQLVNKLLSGDPLPAYLNIYKDYDIHVNHFDVPDVDMPSKKLPVNQGALKAAWDSSSRQTKEDWQEWIGRLSKELLKQSPSHAIRACAGLATDYHPLAKDLFNASFASCWSELYSQHQEELVESFCIALSSANNPPEIHQILLNLAEFMEHDDKSLPIAITTLGQYAQRCHAYAKALHYQELEFYVEPTTPTIESLISINIQLQQSDAAVGILKHAQLHHDLQLKETWYEKLQRWDDALRAYSLREKQEPDNMEITMGKMRCYHALGEWEQLSELAQSKWNNSSSDIKRGVAPLAAAAAWGLGQWDRMDACIKVMKTESPDKAFFNAILSLHRNSFEDASNHILKARDLLVTEITALVSESYNRAYGVVVRVQMLAELEEIIKYKCLPQGSEKRVIMRKTWNTRLLGCQRNVDIWQRMLKVRALVIKPKQDMDMWIKFANLCRKSGRLNLAEKSLNYLLEEGSPENPSRAPPQVVYAQLKYMWAKGQQREALRHLVDFTTRMSQDLGLNPNDLITQPLPSEGPGIPKHVEEYTKLLARCFLKQGEWQILLNNNWRTETSEIILGAYLLATHFDDKWYKAWHNWALANFEVISLFTSQNNNGNNGTINVSQGEIMDQNDQVVTSSDEQSQQPQRQIQPANIIPMDVVQRHVVPSIKGFFHAIALSNTNSLQNTLRLLTLWFKFGGIPEAAQAMNEGFNMVKIDNWLEVVPQLISRIHQPNQTVSRSLIGLLSDLGKAHPQALVYPLAVAVTSESVSRKRAALSIIDKMRLHWATLVDQSDLVSHELIRVAVLWHEQWYEGLEDASRLFFGEKNTEKMFEVLEPLHQMLQKGPETMREASFNNAFGRELADAYEWVLNFRRTKDITNLNQAWDIYYNVFRRISRQLPQLSSLELQYVSPKLEEANNLELAAPGTYHAGKPTIKIVKFDPTFSVISSKQRPRKLSCKGSDGKEYQYVLKGHEDIRQDNLVMQLFGLVNTLLVNDPECFKRHLDIQQYPAIPLSPKVGLLGWVPNSDTFHVLIREYRESRKILLNIEHRIMLQMAPDYDSLTLLQKVEVFTGALDNTRGQDLYKVLWLKSKSSEAWLDRRTTYTRSLAVMSMVGYILGLGDRHPSNLMLNRITGKVIHIDFGDCFEAAILREKYPEKVPFRLTRMLNYAMEVSGIEGSFRITCEHVMRVLRDNKESLMAILEAFAYDPLINWGFDFPTKAVAEATGINVPQVNIAELLRREQIDEQEAARLTRQNEIEIRNARAALVLKRITDKLTGNDIKRLNDLDVPTQVDKLIQQATSVESLCQHYIGWCSFW